jgi:hypothetical protein
MRSIALLLIPALALSSAISAHPLLSSGFETSPQFTLEQNLSVETVTCKYWFSHADLSQHGAVTGTDCQSTGAIPLEDGDGGNVGVDFWMGDGSHVVISNCRIDSTVLLPGGNSLAINCTHS